MTIGNRLWVMVAAALGAWAGLILIVLAALWLTGCEDRAWPLDCYPRCIERLG